MGARPLNNVLAAKDACTARARDADRSILRGTERLLLAVHGTLPYRSLDQPVCGLLRREGRTTLYVQREVAGIYSPTQDCCNKPTTRLEAVDVTRWIN